MNVEGLLKRGLNKDFLTIEEGVFLFGNAPTADLVFVANELRKQAKNNSPKVKWIIDRNVTTTNVCTANSKCCNFYRIPGHAESYITDIATYRKKIDETFRYGCEQLGVHGELHPYPGRS